MLTFPDIDPIAIAIGPLHIRWYALAYLAGILLGWGWMARQIRRMEFPPLSGKQLEDLVFWAVLGVMLGGRLGYVFFYNAPYYLAHPQEIFMVWEGGMAFHGGMLGVITAFYLFCRRQGVAFWPVIDLAATATPIGLFFGRLANFVNGELFGRMTESSLGMVFPHGGPYPRHPSQLYEAALEGVVLFALLYLVSHRTRAYERRGLLSGLFLAGYGCARFTVEFFREPDAQIGFLALGLSMGQLLSLPMILLGAYLIIRTRRTSPHAADA